MKILRLELFGFKSFKDKTIITFDQAITAIVGSNGCGKSNVVDALYWVMGDMSPKHLRGTSMTDVIFSGSRDASAMDLAEVSLVLQRVEGDPELAPQFQHSNEIQITRRYYRSGEGEYFINKVPCRLRDIQEFFMDTGVGAKAYSIIEQGSITRMVAQKPEERRTVIEEVAGILKFKARKAETERKLASADVNMKRIDDILGDLQKQLSNLKRQAEKAEKYKVFSEELRALEIRLASREWVDRSYSKETTLQKIAEFRFELEQIETSLEEDRLKLDTTREDLAVLESRFKEQSDAARRAMLELKDIDAHIAASEAHRNSAEKRRESNNEQLLVLDQNTTRLEETLSELAIKIESDTEQVEIKLEEIQRIHLSLNDLRRNNERLRQDAKLRKEELHREELALAKIVQGIQSHQKQLAHSASRKDQIRTQLLSVQGEIDEKTSERTSTLSYLEFAFSTRSDLEKEKSEVDSELSTFDSMRHGLEKSRNEIQSELLSVQVRKEQLEILDREMEGVGATARELALHRQDQGAVRSLFVDDVKTPPVLEKAVEAVLNRHLQRVTSESLEGVAEARRFLVQLDNQEAKAGRAQFWIPMWANRQPQVDTNSLLENSYILKDSSSPDSNEIPGPDGLIGFKVKEQLSTMQYLEDHPAVIGPLKALIQNELPLGIDLNWTAHLSSFWVVRTREDILNILDEVGVLPVSMVSLEGDIFSSDGLIDLAPVVSDSEESTRGIIQRKRRITELRALELQITERLVSSQADLDHCLNELNRAKEKFRELTARLSALNPDVDRHSLLLRQVEAQLARLQEKQHLLEQDQQRCEEEEISIGAEVEHLTQELMNLEAQKLTVHEAVLSAEEALQSIAGQVSDAESDFESKRSELRLFEQDLSNVKSSQAAVDQELRLTRNRHETLTNENESLEQELVQMREELEAIQSDYATKQETLSELQAIEAQLADELAGVKQQTLDLEKLVSKLGSERQFLADQLNERQTSVAVHDVELRNLSDKMITQYQIAFSALSEDQLNELTAASDMEEACDPSEAKSYAETLRQKIDRLGKINMIAVEEFEELRSRYEYLFIQRQDVADGMQQLRDAIDRIDRESRTRFAEAFNAVNSAFQSTFPILFGGGNAELRLTQPDNMLETGVEIVAQPPGKKLQSVTLLSGGEKALTAVSMIFGIFSIKPSPFCVLDEVDAPLDDSNVNRFNIQVRKMAETSQIIMITHHKKTMESSDALYGVTMEQPGISKVASARLGQLKTISARNG